MAILGASVVNGKLEADELQVVAASGALAMNVKGNAKIDGDLEVNGDVTYIGEQDLRISDKTIEVGYLDPASGSVSSASLNGAGIYAGPIGGSESFKLIAYDHDNEKIVFGKPISATISGSIDHAEAASKVDHSLTIKGDGVTETVFDGSEAKTVNIDLSGKYETIEAHDADIDAVEDRLDVIEGEGEGSVKKALADAEAYTDAEIQKLDAVVANTASAAGAEDSTQILVTVNEQDGKLVSVDVNAPAFQTAAQAATDLQAAKDYADQKDTALHTTITGEINDATSSVKTWAEGQFDAKGDAAQALADAKTYTETVSGSLKTYADNAAATAKTESIEAAESYTDTAIAALDLDNKLDEVKAEAVATASADATSKADAAETASKAYADEKIEALDAEFEAEEGYYVTGLTQVDGKITAVASASIVIPDVPQYTMVKQETPDSGSAATYYLTKDNVQVGAKIQIAKDQFLKSADFFKDAESVPTAKQDYPTDFAFPGIRFEFWTGEAKSSVVWVSVKDLVDVYTAGDGLVLSGNEFSVKLDEASEGYLSVSEDGIKLEGVDAAISGAVAAEAEIARAAEQANSASIAAVDAAYKAADITLSGSIATEIDRAKAAEEANADNIAAMDTAYKAADTALGNRIAAFEANGAHDVAALEGRVTTAESEIDALQADAHTHENKDELDLIETGDVAKWNTAAGKAHEHSNKTVLDGITETKVANWDRAYADVNASSGSWNAAGAWVAANKTAVEQAVTDVNAGKANWNAAYTQSQANATAITAIQAKDEEQDGRLDTIEAATASYMNVNGENSNITKDLTFADGAGIVRYANNEFEFVFGE